MRHFTGLSDVEDLTKLVERGIYFRTNPLASKDLGQGKKLGLIFLNPSLRTRLSTQIAASNLGIQAFTIDQESSWGFEFDDGTPMIGKAGEHIKEAARVFGEFFDMVGVRSFPELKDRKIDEDNRVIKGLLNNCGKPVINLESSSGHPLQALADMMTIEMTKKKSRPKVVLTWAPHIKALPHAVPHSFAEWANAMDYELVVTHPKGYELHPRYMGHSTLEYDQDKALEDADFVYCKNWSALNPYGEILCKDPSWMMTSAKMSLTKQGQFLHCLPVRRNLVVSDDVLDGPNSLVTLEAGNRVFAAQAVLEALLNG